MPGYDETRKIIEEMQQQGKAWVVVDLVAYANDLDFATNPPSCRVTVTVTNPETNEVVETHVADIPTTTSPFRHEFTIRVETIARGWKRKLKSEKPRALNVQIVAEPINGFEEWYESGDGIGEIHIRAASRESRSFALKPKAEGSRLGTKRLDKPRLKL